MALTDKLTAIADAIRDKTGKTNTMTLDQMPTEIENIGGGYYISKSVTIEDGYISIDLPEAIADPTSFEVKVNAAVAYFGRTFAINLYEGVAGDGFLATYLTSSEGMDESECCWVLDGKLSWLIDPGDLQGGTDVFLVIAYGG